jgi:hypothetical protein
MPIDIDKIRDAFGKFENDDFISAREILQQEIHTAKTAHLQNKLGLRKETEVVEPDVDEACGTKKTKKKVK